MPSAFDLTRYGGDIKANLSGGFDILNQDSGQLEPAHTASFAGEDGATNSIYIPQSVAQKVLANPSLAPGFSIGGPQRQASGGNDFLGKLLQTYVPVAMAIMGGQAAFGGLGAAQAPLSIGGGFPEGGSFLHAAADETALGALPSVEVPETARIAGLDLTAGGSAAADSFSFPTGPAPTFGEAGPSFSGSFPVTPLMPPAIRPDVADMPPTSGPSMPPAIPPAPGDQPENAPPGPSTLSTLKDIATVLTPAASIFSTLAALGASRGQLAGRPTDSATSPAALTPVVPPPVPMPIAGASLITGQAVHASLLNQLMRRGRASTILTSPSEKLGV